jgi:hypothetical protein
MNSKTPEILLLGYLFLPIGHPGVAAILLNQIKSINLSRIAERKLAIDPERDSNESLQDFFRAFMLNPTNAAVYTYLELITPELGWFDQNIQRIRHKVDNDNFEFSSHAVDQLIAKRIQISEIRESIANGQLIKSDDKQNSKYMSCGLTQAHRAICLNCSSPNRPVFNIIAVQEIDPELWDDNFTPRINSNND